MEHVQRYRNLHPQPLTDPCCTTELQQAGAGTIYMLMAGKGLMSSGSKIKSALELFLNLLAFRFPSSWQRAQVLCSSPHTQVPKLHTCSSVMKYPWSQWGSCYIVLNWSPFQMKSFHFLYFVHTKSMKNKQL